MTNRRRRLRVLTVIGTRPEAVKLAPVVRELRRHPPDVRSVVCATAQHRDLLDQALDTFDVQCDYDLNVMGPDQCLSDTTATILTRLDQIVRTEEPDWLLVQGDTTTAMAASMVAYYHRIPVGHVEAGLRT